MAVSVLGYNANEGRVEYVVEPKMPYQEPDANVLFSESAISALCHRWKIRELALFGSVLRDDFGPSSDLDILVAFADGATWGLFDHVRMQSELEGLLRRDVDLVTKPAVERSRNWLRKQAILDSAQVLYAERKTEVDDES
jgi:predicted nucleotidyltransferase